LGIAPYINSSTANYYLPIIQKSAYNSQSTIHNPQSTRPKIILGGTTPMSAVTAWLTGILAVVILGTVVDLLLSESKMGKYVRSVFAAVTVLVIVLPIPGFIQNGCNFENDFIIENSFTLDESYLSYANRVKLDHLAKGVEEQLRQDGIKNAYVAIEGQITVSDIKIQLVRVNLKNAVIDENKAHINKYELVSGKVAEYLSIEKGQIVIEM